MLCFCFILCSDSVVVIKSIAEYVVRDKDFPNGSLKYLLIELVLYFYFILMKWQSKCIDKKLSLSIFWKLMAKDEILWKSMLQKEPGVKRLQPKKKKDDKDCEDDDGDEKGRKKKLMIIMKMLVIMFMWTWSNIRKESRHKAMKGRGRWLRVRAKTKRWKSTLRSCNLTCLCSHVSFVVY